MNTSEVIIENNNNKELLGLKKGTLFFKRNVDSELYIEVPCAIVTDGQDIFRVISKSGLFKSFDRGAHGAIRVPGFPGVIGSKTLASFIDKEEKKLLEPIYYRFDRNRSGEPEVGYNAEALIVIIKAYIRAEEENVLKANQLNALKQAKCILLGLAGERVRDLVDKATGFIGDEESGIVEKFVKKMYLNDKALTTMNPKFTGEFYQEIFRLHGWKFDKEDVSRPGYVGIFTNKYIYNLVPDFIMEDIRKRNKRDREKDYYYKKNKNYQFLTENTGGKALDEIIDRVTMIMRISKDRYDFDEKYNIAFKEKLENKGILAYQRAKESLVKEITEKSKI